MRLCLEVLNESRSIAEADLAGGALVPVFGVVGSLLFLRDLNFFLLSLMLLTLLFFFLVIQFLIVLALACLTQSVVLRARRVRLARYGC